MYYEIVIFPIAKHLWRWEIRLLDGAIIRCGTAKNKVDAECEADTVLDVQGTETIH
jgi:hypothetical protein